MHWCYCCCCCCCAAVRICHGMYEIWLPKDNKTKLNHHIALEIVIYFHNAWRLPFLQLQKSRCNKQLSLPYYMQWKSFQCDEKKKSHATHLSVYMSHPIEKEFRPTKCKYNKTEQNHKYKVTSKNCSVLLHPCLSYYVHWNPIHGICIYTQYKIISQMSFHMLKTIGCHLTNVSFFNFFFLLFISSVHWILSRCMQTHYIR